MPGQENSTDQSVIGAGGLLRFDGRVLSAHGTAPGSGAERVACRALLVPRANPEIGTHGDTGQRHQNEKRVPSWIARGPPEPNTWKMREVGCIKLAVFLRSPL